MDLQKEFEKEKGYDCFVYRQDYAGAHQYKDGFSDDYVEWLESKVNNVALDYVSQRSELLLAFFDELDELPMGLMHYDREKVVENFIANNCG